MRRGKHIVSLSFSLSLLGCLPQREGHEDPSDAGDAGHFTDVDASAPTANAGRDVIGEFWKTLEAGAPCFPQETRTCECALNVLGMTTCSDDFEWLRCVCDGNGNGDGDGDGDGDETQ